MFQETESLNKKQLEELSRHPKEIRNGLEVILTQIPKEWQASFLHLWLWNESLYTDILKLNDEISDIGRSVMHMQKALKELVELDALTKIYNRRSGENRLKDIIKKSEDRNTSFSIAIGDIDFFKKVNDTYGHDAGDIVLQQTARILKNGVVVNV